VSFVAAYSKNVYVGGFPFFGATESFDDAAASPSGGVFGFRQVSASSAAATVSALSQPPTAR